MRTKLPTCPIRYPCPFMKASPDRVVASRETLIVAPLTSWTVPNSVGSADNVPLLLPNQFFEEAAETTEVAEAENRFLGACFGRIIHPPHGQIVTRATARVSCRWPLRSFRANHCFIGGKEI